MKSPLLSLRLSLRLSWRLSLRSSSRPSLGPDRRSSTGLSSLLRSLSLPLLPLLPLLLTACASLPPPASEAQALAQWGPPTARYPLADGQSRLEYATGPNGRSTWMLDVGADGQVRRARQMMDESQLRQVQAALPMPAAELLQTLGTPGQRRSGGWQGGQVWSWRYPTYDCLWFQVSVNDQGRALDGAFLPDPVCEDQLDR